MRIRVLALVAVSVVLLSGCGTSDPVATPTSDPVATPLFTTDAEALAAAEEAYAKFQAMEDKIGAEGGADPDRIREFAVRDALEGALAGYRTYANDQLHTAGTITIGNSSLIDVDSNVKLNAVILITCLDVSAADLLNSSGQSMVPNDRVDRQTFKLAFDVSGNRLLLSTREKNEKENRCV
jgi:hypothetical protein